MTTNNDIAAISDSVCSDQVFTGFCLSYTCTPNNNVTLIILIIIIIIIIILQLHTCTAMSVHLIHGYVVHRLVQH